MAERCCPDCGTLAIRPKSPRGSDEREQPEAWGCRRCGHHFDTPDTRERNGHAKSVSAAGKALVEADPDDLTGETA